MVAKVVKSVIQATMRKPKEYVIPPEETGEEEIILLFDENLPSDKEVVKLGLDNLPATYNGQEVKWIGNFGIRRKIGGAYVDGISYQVIVTPRTGYTLVYYNGATGATQMAATTSAPSGYSGKVAFSLAIGDPGSGWIGAN